jgi:hypothetical protein
MVEDNFDLEAVFEARRAEFGNMRMDSENAGTEGGQGPTDTAPTNVGGEADSQQEPTGQNPAWNEILGVLPTSLHSQILPALQKWDQNYQQGISKVHSQYEPYKPIIEAGYEPENIGYAMQVLQILNEDPRQIYDALAEQNGWAVEQGQQLETDENYDGEVQPDPRLLRAEQMSEAVAEYVLQQHQEQQQAQEDAALDAEINGLKEKHGLANDTYVDQFVLAQMLAGTDANAAFEEYNKFRANLLQTPRAATSAPVVMGAGSGLPSSQITSEQLKDKGSRKNIVQQMLAAAQQGTG